MRKVIISILVSMFVGSGMGSIAAAGGTLCGVEITGALTIITSQRLAGEVTFDGYRLTANGRLARARWTGGNELLGMSDTVALGSDAFAEARRTLGSVAPAEREASAEDTTMSPPVRTYELAISEGANPARFVYRNRPARAMTGLMEEWAGAAPLVAPASGDYVWAVPVAHDPGRADVTLRAGACDDAGAARVAASLASAHLVSRQTATMTEDMNIDRTGRQRFIAEMPGGFAYFGVLTAR